jgi:hypothetical protein
MSPIKCRCSITTRILGDGCEHCNPAFTIELLREEIEALKAWRVIRRVWINQPSNLQPLHKYHGMNALADVSDPEEVTVYFLRGAVVSMMLPSNVLSEGWRTDATQA